MMNIVVVSVYWSILHESSLADCQGDKYKIFNVYWVHILPGFSVASNFALTDVVLRRNDYKGLVLISIIYGVVNYFETKKRGKPLYHFLTWEDASSVFIYGGLIAGFTLVFIALSKVTVGIKRAKNIQSSSAAKQEIKESPKKKKR